MNAGKYVSGQPSGMHGIGNKELGRTTPEKPISLPRVILPATPSLALTIGKSRGERQVIFSSSGAIHTTKDLIPPRVKFRARVLLKCNRRARVFDDVVHVVDVVEVGEKTKNDTVLNGVEVDKERETDSNAIQRGCA
ncbi:Uncharacterized protein Fot_03485 [Forsythia ovata]|uniref:Uncharacterized protein n=1 Tax=Forsythia ovata TaxID=205694 RepID=A0ABD1X9U0_9LAMI